MKQFAVKTSYLLSLLILIFCFKTVSASNPAVLIINITDSQGNVVLGSRTILTNEKRVVLEKINTTEPDILFPNLQVGEYELNITATGFAPFTKKIRIKPGENKITVVLEISEIKEKVEIKRDPQEKAIDESFSTFFTQEQIDALPDTGEEIKRELQNRYGSDVIIRVDGFSNRIPDKSRIASIKASLSSYDAQNHELGFIYVDITTKVTDQSLSGSIGLNFNDESLNARNPFSPSRLPEQDQGINLFLFGPLRKNSSSFYLYFGNNRNLEQKNIIARVPSGSIQTSVNTISNSTGLQFSIKQNLPKNHTGGLTYIFDRNNSRNLGVGDFDLAERAFASNSQEHILQFSESGYIGKKFFNEIQAEYRNSQTEINPLNDNPSINVLDAFNSGGAGNQNLLTSQKFWIADNLLFAIKKHSLKVGVLFQLESLKEVSRVNNNGTFLFSSLEDFTANRPSLFTIVNGQRETEVSQNELGVYVQDDFRVRKNLSLSLGLRYERQNNLKDNNNFSPRIGFTWSPSKSGQGTFRGGIGLFYNWFEAETLSVIRSFGVEQPNETIITNPVFPIVSLGGTAQSLPQSFRTTASTLKNPYVIHSSFGYDGKLNRNIDLRINYIFQKGVRQFRSRNTNAPRNGVRPDANFGNIIQVESSGFFVSNSLEIGLSGRLIKGVAFGLNYELAKKINDVDGVFGLPSDNFNLTTDRSVANDDQRHRIFASVSWRIRKQVLITATYNINSPLPYTITTGRDENQDTSFNDRPFGVLRNSERGTWRNQLDLGASWTFSFLKSDRKIKGNTAVIFSSSDIAKDSATTDAGKRLSLRLFVSSRNLLNQTNFRQFVGVQTSPFFRQPISADNSRRIELGMRLNF